MRYPRNAKIFRGQIDAAPFAGVFFLLVLMVFLFSTNVFIPGVKVALQEDHSAPEVADLVLKVLETGRISYRGDVFHWNDFEKTMRREFQAGTLPPRLLLLAEPKAEKTIVEKVRSLALEFGVALRGPGSRLELPEDVGYPGIPNPRVVVGINLNGQLFYEHQLIQEQPLREKLGLLAQKEGPITLVVQADREVPYEQVLKLGKIAREAGVNEMVLATRPKLAQ